jgi:hypothetical protein
LKRHKALFAVIAAVAALTAIGVNSATADPGGTNHAYVCFSSIAGPMLVSADDTSVYPTWDTYATGYFTPLAETSVPTTTEIAGWYLTCSLPAGWTEIGSYILGDGSKVDLSGPTGYLQNSVPVPGVYPVIQPAAPATTTGS